MPLGTQDVLEKLHQARKVELTPESRTVRSLQPDPWASLVGRKKGQKPTFSSSTILNWSHTQCHSAARGLNEPLDPLPILLSLCPGVRPSIP